MDKIKKYDNGLTLIVSEGGARSVSFSIMVGTGAINETDKTNGLSHYIEHMIFKGTSNYNAYEITEKLDALGASYNAYTSMDATCFYSHVIKLHLEENFKIFSDMVFNSSFLDEEAEKEKNVILEEISMNEDTPEDVCQDLVMEAFFGKNGYGRQILGTSKNVKSFTRKDVQEYLDKYYVTGNTVISFAGNITLSEAEDLILKYVLPVIKVGSRPEMLPHNVKNNRDCFSKSKDIEQVHFTLLSTSSDYKSKDRVVSEMFVNILGGGMSSRLFRRVREELGLAYSVGAYSYRYIDVGVLAIYAGVNRDKYLDAFKEILNVLKDLKESGITIEEFKKAKTRLLSSTIFSEETFVSKVQLFSKYYLMTGELYDFNKRIKSIENVTYEDVLALSKSINLEDIATAVVGKNVRKLLV